MRALQVPPVVPYKPLEKFSKALYGTTGGTYSARIFRPVKNALQVLYKSFNKYIILLRGNSSQIGLLGIQTNTLSSLGKLISWLCLNQLYHTKWYGQNCLWPGLFKTTQRKTDIARHSTHSKQ